MGNELPSEQPPELSIEEKLAAKKRAREEELAARQRSMEEDLAAKKKAKEEELASDLRSQISKIQEERDSLQAELEKLKQEYEEGHVVANEFQGQSAELQGVYDKYEDVLKDEGIENRSQMLRNEDYIEDEKVVKFRETGKRLRGTVTSIKGSKESLKDKVPDLDFRGGKKGNESPRDISYKKIEAKIAELDKQIKELEAQTPEKIASEKNVAECLTTMKQEYLPFAFTRSSLMMRDFASCTLSENRQGYIQSLIERFGEEDFKEALLRSLSVEMDKSIDANKRNLQTYEGFDFDTYKEKILRAMEAKIDQQLIQRKIDQFKKDHPTIEEIRQEANEIKSDREHSADYQLKAVQERKAGGNYEEWSQSKINIEFKQDSGKRAEAFITYEYDPNTETDKTSSLKRRLDQNRARFEQLRREKQTKIDNPPMFIGKQKHSDTIEDLTIQIQALESEIQKDNEEYVRLKQEQERESKKNIWELAQLLNPPRSFGKHFDSHTYRKTTVGTLLDLAEKYWQDAKERTLDPEKAPLFEEFQALVNQEEDFRRAFEREVQY